MGPKSRFRGRTWLPRRLRAFFLSQWWRPAILSAILLAVITLQRTEHAVWPLRGLPQADVTENGWRRDQSIGAEWFDRHRTGGQQRYRQSMDAPSSQQYGSVLQSGARFDCSNPRVIDGDTIDCGGRRVRLQGIDAPEMPGHCAPGRICTPGDPYRARDFLQGLAAGAITCMGTDTDRYGRTVARCSSAGRDMSCEMIRAGHAAPRYVKIDCP